MRRIATAILVLLVTAQAPAWAAPSGNPYFISQMRDPAWNPEGPEWSANCGPACLAMAFRAFGVVAPDRSAQDLIRRVRFAITGSLNDFHVTSLEGIRRAAERNGLATGVIYGPEAVAMALEAGQLIILAGNPRAYNTRFGEREYQAFSGAHFVLVTGWDAEGVWINDPLSRVGAVRISPAELAAFMGYRSWDTGLSLSPPGLQARQVLLEAQR